MNHNKDSKKNAELLRKLQNKLRKQRQDLQRNHEYDLKQKLKEQSEEYQNEIESLNVAKESELTEQKDQHQQELQSLKEELQLTHKNEIAEKENEISNIRQDSQTQFDYLQQTNDKLSAHNEELQDENEKLKSESDELMHQKQVLIDKMKNESINIQNDINQWISIQQSNTHSFPKKYNFEDIEAKLMKLNKTAKHFIETRLNIWNEANEELDSIVIELDDKQKIIDDVNNEIEFVRNNLDLKTRDLERIQRNYQDDLVRDVNEYKIRMQNLHKNIESEIENKQKIEAELMDVTEANNDFLSHIKVVEKQNNEFEVKVNHQQQIINELKDKLNKNDIDSQQHQKHIMSLQMELQQTILEKKDLSRQLADKSDELIQYKTKLVTTDAAHRKQINSLEIGLQNALNELRDKTRDCQRLKERVENISDHLKARLSQK